MPSSSSAPQGRQSILPLFPLLSSHQVATRLDASHQLLAALPLSTPDSLTSDADTPYALKRLIAGLASSNEAARQGFAVALAQLVALLPDERAQHVLPQLVEQTTSKQGMDSREERDLLFARLMGLHALVRSGILTRSEGNASNNGESWQEVVQALVTLANKKTWIREPSYWVVCEALRTLLESEAEWKDDCVKWAVQRLVNDSREKARGWGPEKVAIVLVLQSHGVDADWTSILAPTFPSGSLLSRTSLPALASALKGAAASSLPEPPVSGPKQGANATKTSKGAAAPAPGQAPHFVWSLIRDTYFGEEGEKAVEGQAKFVDFWRVCVDQALFASPSLPLKSLGFSLVTLFLPSLPPSAVSSVLGLPSFLRVFANHLRGSLGAGGAGAGGEKTLSRVADKLASSTLPAYLASKPEAALPLLKALIAPPHSQHNAFEPKVLERFVARLPLSGVKGWIAHLQEIVLSPSAAEEETEEGEEDLDQQEREKRLTAQRTWALDQLLHVGKNGGVAKDDEAMKGLLEFLAVVGWFEVTKEGSKGARSYIPTPAFTLPQRLAARSRFFSVLTALVCLPSTISAASSSSATPAVPTVAGGPAWLARALALLDNLAADDKHFARAGVEEDEDDDEDEGKELEGRVKALYTALSAPAAPVKEKKKGRKSAGGAADAAPEDPKEVERKATARALIEGVRLVAWDEGREDAADVLESTADAVAALFPTIAKAAGVEVPASAPAGDAAMDVDGEEDEAPEPSTILVDLLLALIRRPSAFVKSVAGVAMKGFADEVGAQAVELLVEQWRVEEEVVEAVEEEGEAEKEEKPAKGKGKKEAKEESDDEDDDEDDSGDESGSDFEVDEAFKNELLAALEAGGMGVPDGATGSDDEDDEEEPVPKKGKKDDEESDEEEILDDEAMLELDERLADIFRANGGGRRSSKRDRTDSLHYRLRCLDLLDVLAHHSPASPLLVPTLVPLFNLVRTATAVEAELQTKAGKLLRFLVQPRKAASPAPATVSQPAEETAAAALESLEELHRIAASVDQADLAPLAAQVALALVKAAVASAPSSAPAQISTLAAESFEAYLTTKNAKTRCQPLLMGELARRAPAAVWEAREKVLALATAEKVNAFRRVQAFEVIQTLVTSYAGLKTAESKLAVLAFLPAYRTALFDTISSSLSSSTSASASSGAMDAARLKLLTKHALSSARLAVQLSSQSDAASAWKPAEWAALLDPSQGKVSDRFKGATAVLGLVKQLVGVLGGSVGEAAPKAKKDKKRKAAELDTAAAPAAASAATATPNGKQAKKAKGTPSAAGSAKKAAAPSASKPEEEVQDESAEAEVAVEADEEAGDVSMAVSEVGTPSGKSKGKGGKKDKKRRRESGAGKA
ncbi:hypothetical protein JCM8097_007471 [Rhodosporidiobolus ruineniae]